MLFSCFSHIVHLGDGSFLQNLSPGLKKPPSVAAPGVAETVSVNTQDDGEDTEAGIEELVKALADMNAVSDNARSLSSLLLKIRGFVVKASSRLALFRCSLIFTFRRYEALGKRKSISANAARRSIARSWSSLLIATPDGDHGTVSCIAC